MTYAFPEEKTFDGRKTDLTFAKRQTSETILEFWVRLNAMAVKLIKAEHESRKWIEKEHVHTFLTELSTLFETNLVTAYYLDPQKGS